MKLIRLAKTNNSLYKMGLANTLHGHTGQPSDLVHVYGTDDYRRGVADAIRARSYPEVLAGRNH